MDSQGMTWKMRRLTANEHPQLWHLQVSEQNGYYRTACGLRFGVAGSASRSYVPGGACARCLARNSNVGAATAPPPRPC
jgi:hypothetical protein